MPDTSARLLRLLSLLQARPDWTGPELADRLGVTVRTVRRDIDRLRTLGYPVDSVPGVAGGYRLGVGGSLPPLLLDDDEALAVAVALSAATAVAGVRGIEDGALAALAKIDRLLPPRLRARVAALHQATERLAFRVDDVDAGLLVTLSQAATELDRVRLDYVDREGRPSERRIEPYRLVATGRRWYLVAYDVDRVDWRTFRVDRIGGAHRIGHRFERFDPPDAGELVRQSIAVRPYRFTAVVAVAAAADEVAGRVPPTVATVEPDGPAAAVLTTGADDLDVLAGYLVGLGLPFEVLEPPELRARILTLASELLAAHGPTPAPEPATERHQFP